MRWLKENKSLCCDNCREPLGYVHKSIYVSGCIYCEGCRKIKQFLLDDVNVDRWDRDIFSPNFTDFELQGNDGGIVKCHKVVLAGKNKVFKAMFNSKMSEAINNRVKIPDMSGLALRHFVEFLYTGTISPKALAMHAPELYKGSHMYDVTHLTKICEEFLAHNTCRYLYASIDIVLTYDSQLLEESILPYIFCESFVVSNDPEYVTKVLAKAWTFDSFEEYRKDNSESILDIMGKATKLMAGHIVTKEKNQREVKA